MLGWDLAYDTERHPVVFNKALLHIQKKHNDYAALGCCLLTRRLHTAPCRLCMSGVRRTWSVVTMASPINSQWEEPEDPTPEHTNMTTIVIMTKADNSTIRLSQLTGFSA